ncbi:DUF2157 domain-containing protein [Paenibacillus sp. HJGM_3]|uniref:DUF2157 domain-containing protein n=1 Tax=Paenibacillus sp. HJGM_3 TaxID=3379816 RepID=UPI0038585023
MSKKWLEHEGARWVERQIVTKEQYNQILSLYDDKKHAVGILPILGSVLVGLGILSFIAANWQDISQMLRLVIILAVMSGFYAAGDRLLKRGHEKLGIALIGIGLIAFGGGIVLVGQMFHMVAYDVKSFLVWGTAGILTTYLYRSRYLFLISLLILNIAQLYSASSFHDFNWIALMLTVVGLGWYAYRWANSLLTWLLGLSILLHAIVLLAVEDGKLLWFYLIAMAMYSAGDWLRDRSQLSAVQSAPLTGAYLMGLFLVLFARLDSEAAWMDDHLLPSASVYFPILLVLLAVSAYGKWRRKREGSALEWLLFLPLAYLPGSAVEVTLLIALFLFSLYVLWRGYAEEWRMKINIGTLLFLFTTMVAYTKLTWGFMDKSLFFLIGGGMLLTLSWLLNRRKKQVLEDTKEG